MTPLAVANSDALKTCLMETGEVIVGMWHPSQPLDDIRVDRFVDAIRTMASDLGFEHDEIRMSLLSPTTIRVSV